MSDLPTGTVTFLFTDIEGSTRLLKQLGRRYDAILAEHDRIVRQAIAAQHGRVVDTQGDSFLAVFGRAGDAVVCAMAAQRVLEAHEWPGGVRVRVRMGLHSGEPRASGERYVGFGVHRAARVGAVAHGGQILVSSATRALVEDELPSNTRLRDLGRYRLKDVDRPEQLFQVESAGLQQSFGKLRAERAETSRIPRQIPLLAGAVIVVATATVLALVVRGDGSPSVGSAGNPITIVVPWGGRDGAAFRRVLDAFRQRTDLRTHVTTPPEGRPVAEHVRGLVASGDTPMLSVLSTPGAITEYAGEGIIKPLATLGVERDALHRAFGKPWVDLMTVNGEVYGFPVKVSSKGLVWHRPDDLRALGIEVPKTWTELLSATRRLAALGETPWAVSGADTWTLTDWFENVYLRTAGADSYSRLFAGKLSFEHESVRDALREMTALLNDRYLVGGVAGALGTGFGDAIGFVFFATPRAHLYMEGGFVGSEALQYVKPTPKPGKDIGAARFPTMNVQVGSPVVAVADVVVAHDDDGAVRELLAFLHSSEAASLWVHRGGSVISPHRGVRLSTYRNVLARTEALQLTRATAVRFDGSDSFPGSLAQEWGSTLQKVLERPRDIPRLVAEFQLKAAPVLRR
jgi:alpha-glucoside transport system substrate-binding protein